VAQIDVVTDARMGDLGGGRSASDLIVTVLGGAAPSSDI
jgi:hypothetical protein